MTNPPWPLESEATLWPPARVATNSFFRAANLTAATTSAIPLHLTISPGPARCATRKRRPRVSRAR